MKRHMRYAVLLLIIAATLAGCASQPLRAPCKPGAYFSACVPVPL